MALGFVAYALQSILIPFTFAAFLSILYKPIVTRLRRWHVPMFLCIAFVIGITIGAFWIMYIISAASIQSIIEKGPVYQQRFLELQQSFNVTWKELTTAIYGRSIVVKWESMVDFNTVSRTAAQWFGSLVSLLTDLLVVLFFMIFMIASGERFPEKVRLAFAHIAWVNISDILATVNGKVLRYLRVKTLINIANGMVTWGTLELLGVDFAPTFGLIAFFLHYIPNIGSIISVVIPMLLAMIQFDTLTPALLIVVILSGMSLLIGNIIEPQVMGGSFDLSPVTVLFSLLFWGWMWGIAGMLLAIPIMAIIKTILENIPPTRPIAIMLGTIKIPKAKTTVKA